MSADGGSDVLAERIEGHKALTDAAIAVLREEIANLKTDVKGAKDRIGAQERFRIWFVAIAFASAVLLVASDDASAIIKAVGKVLT